MPAPATKQRPYWSYDVGLIHFVGISTEHNYTEGSNQYNWLRADLAAVNRNITPWIILSGKSCILEIHILSCLYNFRFVFIFHYFFCEMVN